MDEIYYNNVAFFNPNEPYTSEPLNNLFDDELSPRCLDTAIRAYLDLHHNIPFVNRHNEMDILISHRLVDAIGHTGCTMFWSYNHLAAIAICGWRNYVMYIKTNDKKWIKKYNEHQWN